MSVARRYLDNCYLIKLRLIWTRKHLATCDSVIDFENIILSMRKIVEGVAFCSLVSAEIRLGDVPRQIKNSWNAEDIFEYLRQKNLLHIPDFARLRLVEKASGPGSPNAWQLEITESREEEVERLVLIYRQCHKFLHEFNPYTGSPLRESDFIGTLKANCEALQKDHMWIWNRIWQHSVRIDGKIFFVNFRDESPSVSPQAVRSNDLLRQKEFDFDPFNWRNVLHEGDAAQDVTRKSDERSP